jgi:hypothetical protein
MFSMDLVTSIIIIIIIIIDIIPHGIAQSV